MESANKSLTIKNRSYGSAESGFNIASKTLTRVQSILALYVSPIIIFIGILGCCLVLLVLARNWRRIKGKDYVLYGITAVDTATVIVQVLCSEFLSNGIGSIVPGFTAPQNLSGPLCRVFGFFWTFSTVSSSNLLCLLAADRVLALMTPFYHRVRMTRRVYLSTLLIALTVLAGASLHSAFLYDSYEFYGSRVCYITPLMDGLQRRILQALTNFFVNGVVAGLILLLCNILLVVKIFRIRSQRVSNQEVRSAVTLIAVACYYLICNLPRALCYFSLMVVQLLWQPNSYTSSVSGMLLSLANVLNWLFYWQCCSNWLLYFIRVREFKEMFSSTVARSSELQLANLAS